MSLPLRRTPVGSGRGYLSNRLRLFLRSRFSRIFPSPPRLAKPEIQDKIGTLRSKLLLGQIDDVLRTRWLHLSGHEKLPAVGEPVHAAVSLVLCLASAQCLRLSVQ